MSVSQGPEALELCAYIFSDPDSDILGTWDYTSCSDFQNISICQHDAGICRVCLFLHSFLSPAIHLLSISLCPSPCHPSLCPFQHLSLFVFSVLSRCQALTLDPCTLHLYLHPCPQPVLNFPSNSSALCSPLVVLTKAYPLSSYHHLSLVLTSISLQVKLQCSSLLQISLRLPSSLTSLSRCATTPITWCRG